MRKQRKFSSITSAMISTARTIEHQKAECLFSSSHVDFAKEDLLHSIMEAHRREEKHHDAIERLHPVLQFDYFLNSFRVQPSLEMHSKK